MEACFFLVWLLLQGIVAGELIFRLRRSLGNGELPRLPRLPSRGRASLLQPRPGNRGIEIITYDSIVSIDEENGQTASALFGRKSAIGKTRSCYSEAAIVWVLCSSIMLLKVTEDLEKILCRIAKAIDLSSISRLSQPTYLKSACGIVEQCQQVNISSTFTHLQLSFLLLRSRHISINPSLHPTTTPTTPPLSPPSPPSSTPPRLPPPHSSSSPNYSHPPPPPPETRPPCDLSL